MPFREPWLPLRDISDAITMIEEFTRGMDFETFRTDPKTVSAVERKLQLISEAATRRGDQVEQLCPGLPWRNIRGIGNWLRHQYDRVDVETVWRTAFHDLPPLQSAVKSVLSARQPNPPRAAVHLRDTEPGGVAAFPFRAS